jgi:hypothetical protein
MKSLVIGMDGVSRKVFQRGWTPFIKNLKLKGEEVYLTNDCISRGWSELILGEHAINSGATYDRPMSNSSHEWTMDWSYEESMKINPTLKKIWMRLSENGISVGVMNVPGIKHTETVNGFIVTGGGGGRPPVSEPEIKDIYPQEDYEILKKNHYILDERFKELLSDKGLRNPAEFFARLTEDNRRKTNSFKDLSIKHQIDFGLLIYKSTFALSEIVLEPELFRKENNLPFNAQIIESAKTFYINSDEFLSGLVSHLDPENVHLVSDHGFTTRINSVDVNLILQKGGYQSKSLVNSLEKKFLGVVVSFIPFKLRQKIKKLITNKGKKTIRVEDLNVFNSDKTVAFAKCYGERVGIYINDAKRFGGVVDFCDIKDTASQISSALNKTLLQNSNLSLTSRILREQDISMFFPDILIDVEDGYFFTDGLSEIVESFSLLDKGDGLEAPGNGETIVVKSGNPYYLRYNKQKKYTINNKKIANLTEVNKAILKEFDLK